MPMNGVDTNVFFVPGAWLMERPARLRNTMVCLVVAMTTTSALLGWIDPSTSLPSPPPSPEAFLPLAVQAVEAAESFGVLDWSGIEVVAGSREPADHTVTSRSLLAATRPTGVLELNEEAVCHFRVDLDGRPSASHHWIHQHVVPGEEDTIRIEVVLPSESDRMTRAQWFSVRALAAVLCDSDHPMESLPLRLGEAWAHVYDLDAENTLH